MARPGDTDFVQFLFSQLMLRIKKLKKPKLTQDITSDDKLSSTDTSIPVEYLRGENSEDIKRRLELKQAFMKGYRYGALDSYRIIESSREEILKASKILGKYNIDS